MNERTKKVYDAFEQKQFRNKLELKRKQEALYASIPKLAELDHAINLQGIRMTREVSRKNPEAIAEFRQSVGALKKQKEALLLQNGYPLDYDAPLRLSNLQGYRLRGRTGLFLFKTGAHPGGL